MEKQISELLINIIKENYDIEIDDIKLEIPPKKDLGDFAFGCFLLSKELKKNTNEIAKGVADFLTSPQPSSLRGEGVWKNNNYIVVDLIESALAFWPYVNIKVNKWIFTDKFLELIKGTGTQRNTLLEQNNKKTIYIDYIWTNVWKPLHIGHMCTPNQGQVIINIYKKLWYNVVSDSHIGDWGIIFGKLIKAYTLWWDENKLKENAVEHLFELYIRATSEAEENPDLDQEYRSEFKKLSEGNSDSVLLWESFTKYSIESMQNQLNRINVKPNYNIWESFYEWLNLPKIEDYPDLKYNMSDIVNELVEKWIATKNEDNSVGIVFDDDKKTPSCILQKRDGTHGYLASELSAIKYRMDNWSLEKIVYFVDVRQSLHLKQAFITAEKAWWLGKTELIHAGNWFISLKDWAMSSRKWRIIKLDKLLDEAEERAKKIILEKRDDLSAEELENLSRIIWIGAIKYWYLKKSRETDVIFDWDEFMTFDWNSGPYIQYAYVRWVRILEKYDDKHVSIIDSDLWEFTFSEEVDLVKMLLNYNKVLDETLQKNMPSILCSYAYSLTKSFSSFYNNVHILNEEDENKQYLRILLIKEFTKILKESFNLLWIEMPEKM